MNSKKRKLQLLIICLLFISFIFFVAFSIQNYNEIKYQLADELLDKEEYIEAKDIYSKLGNYKDSELLYSETDTLAILKENYILADSLLKEGKYVEAITKFEETENYKDSVEKIKEAKYQLAINHFENKDYENAKKLFIESGNYLDSKFYLAQIDIQTLEQSQEIIYQKASFYYEAKNYKDASNLYETIIDYKDSNNLYINCQKQLKRMSHTNVMATGLRNSAVIIDTNTVKVFGNSKYGQTEVDEWKNIISIDIYGTLIIGLQSNGVAKIAGTYDEGKSINSENWNNLIDVAAGEQFIVGLKQDGTVIADGHPSEGQINVDTWENVIAIDAGSRFTVGLTKDCELLFTGVYNNQKNDFEKNKDTWKDVVNIAASGGEKDHTGSGHTVGLKSDGTLVAVGDNTYGQCDFSDTEKWSDIVKVVAGDWYTVGLKSDGTVVMTGENFSRHLYIDESILVNNTNIVDIAAGYGQTLLLTEDGEVLCFGFIDDGKDEINHYKGITLPQY